MFMGGLVVARAVLLFCGDLPAQSAALGVTAGLRDAVSSKLFRLGPAFGGRERTGELVRTAGESVEALDPFVRRYRPAKLLAIDRPGARGGRGLRA